MTTNATATATATPADESPPPPCAVFSVAERRPVGTIDALTMILGYRSERFGYLRCVPCATGEGRHLFEEPIGLLHLFDGQEECCCCGVALVPESLR